MKTDYVYNMIKSILSQRVIQEPNCVPFDELSRSVLEDLRASLNQLVAEKRITFRKNVNGVLLFYDNGRVD